MKKLLIKLSLFVLLILFFLTVGLIMPSTPRTQSSFITAKRDKDSLLKAAAGKRLILVGGSNLSFGINSKLIQDSLKVNPINTGLHAAIGICYMLDATKQFIKRNDIIVVVPEYDQYYGDVAYGKEELLRSIFDNKNYDDLLHLRYTQWLKIIRYMPKYALSKFKISEYRGYIHDKYYSRGSFNDFGDVYTHWQDSTQKFQSQVIKGDMNESVIRELRNFQKIALEKGAKMYISFPCIDTLSYNINKSKITKVEILIHQYFDVLGSSGAYAMPESVMFNTPYHLTKKGADIRTQKLIYDLKNIK
ncbi:hypothetical protein [Siphonobacter sp. SORGH_AS_1065]|uniref:hypothetical protein n=1 Tax=Siphonobacter sp. SORGH_AS_1065 TaxID=3041795 RepID=UPI002783DF1D|nr:hypothetical protein [Siphonobacter sp. SORGH_AS_1065]MDQ1087558.1 hypothetical protein [Siphonobacter sp. SORGH_AS_1065]